MVSSAADGSGEWGAVSSPPAARVLQWAGRQAAKRQSTNRAGQGAPGGRAEFLSCIETGRQAGWDFGVEVLLITEVTRTTDAFWYRVLWYCTCIELLRMEVLHTCSALPALELR